MYYDEDFWTHAILYYQIKYLNVLKSILECNQYKKR